MEVQRTALYDIHLSHGAKMAPFAGFEMPIQYAGIIREHEVTRCGATLFDTCHMGEINVSGATAAEDLEGLVSCRVGTIAVGQCRYGLLCDEAGGVLDDLIVYRLGDESFMVVVNAGTRDSDFEWIRSHCSGSTSLENASERIAKIDLQGPESPRIMQRLVDDSIDGLHYFRFAPNRYRGTEVLVSRTGYTGEIGFEFYADEERARAFWRDAVVLGASPAGLGARDTLRLEMGMPLYGHELGTEHNAADSGLSFAIDSTKDFVGASAIRDTSRAARALVGLQFEGRRGGRAGDTIQDVGGRTIGQLTSGSFAPSLKTAIGMGYVEAEFASHPRVDVLVRGKPLPAEIVPVPFYKQATARRPMAEFL